MPQIIKIFFIVLIAQSVALTHSAIASTIDIKSPKDNIEAWVKLHADSSGKEVFRFGHLMAYGQPSGQKSQKLFQMISLTKIAYRKLANGDYESRNWGCGLYADADTGEIIDEISNPYNGKKIAVKPFCSNISGSRFSVKDGMTTTASFQMDSTAFNRPYLLDWNIVGDRVTVSRSAGTQWEEKSSGKTKYETTVDTFHTSLQELNDPSLTRIDAPYQYTLVTEWMTMLEMGDKPGFMIWVGDATKHSDLSTIPADFLDEFNKRLDEEKLLRPLWNDQASAKTTSDEITKLMQWWPGDYNNAKQIIRLRAEGKPVWLEDDSGKGGHIQVASHYRVVDLPKLADNVLYVEETKHNDPAKIFRQRLYTLKPDPETGLTRVKLYYFNDKKKYVGAWKELDRLKSVSKDELFASPDGCDLIVRKQANKYHMTMDKKACVFGERYFDYQVLLDQNSFWFRDKIQNVEDDAIISIAGEFTYHELDKLTTEN